MATPRYTRGVRFGSLDQGFRALRLPTAQRWNPGEGTEPRNGVRNCSYCKYEQVLDSVPSESLELSEEPPWEKQRFSARRASNSDLT